jgi:hypothetical protein
LFLAIFRCGYAGNIPRFLPCCEFIHNALRQPDAGLGGEHALPADAGTRHFSDNSIREGHLEGAEGDDTTDIETLWFGKKGQGAVLSMIKGLESGAFVHSTHGDATEVYVGNPRRSDWEESFKVEVIEVRVEREYLLT